MDNKILRYCNYAPSKIVNQQFFIVYYVPSVEPAQFNSYQLQPYPINIEGSLYQIIVPEIQRVALNKHLKKYFNMDDMNSDKCYDNGNYTLLCEINQPIISTVDSGSCAVELLTKLQLTHCNLRVMSVYHEIWFQLQTNSWLFVFPTAEEVSVYCESGTDNRLVIGTGLLSVQSMCSIRTEHVHILASGKDTRLRNLAPALIKSHLLQALMKFPCKHQTKKF